MLTARQLTLGIIVLFLLGGCGGGGGNLGDEWTCQAQLRDLNGHFPIISEGDNVPEMGRTMDDAESECIKDFLLTANSANVSHGQASDYVAECSCSAAKGGSLPLAP